MDELDILKKDWQKKGDELPKLSYNDIYKMIWKRSSSIVKWIFIISILEFLLPNILFIFPSTREHVSKMYYGNAYGTFFMIVTFIQYTCIFYFIFQFYKRYKEISVLDDSKTLMKNIIRTRKTVKYYIIFSLGMLLFTMLAQAFTVYFDPNMLTTVYNQELPQGISPEKFKSIMVITFIVVALVTTVLFALIYFLLYGLLLKKLNRNYFELKKMEI
ncbi:hypothetical protein KLA_05962 [Cellulophaga geojensis KL-A]|uniref:Glycerophosphoryl diester phosphodiesterase membrane domain-containing protein n=1 Tax=Cellulophaga geojensis KL-A TaxID=1328323 RepID=A0ABN0RQL2_9FLAO|nr:hypothetical protein [Cellulophaga geojensis]EWH14192.1 hypothetical protein KLA_05962 [Cellulophaga geojensis KL-A]